MLNTKKLFVILCILSLLSQAFASAEFQLNEAALKDMASKGSPHLDQIKATFLASEVQNNQTKEKYAPELFGSAGYSESSERPILAFIPVWSPVKQVQLGVRQNLRYGFTNEAAITTVQQSAHSVTGKYTDITSTTLSYTMQMDLWRDLMGRMSKARLESTEVQSKRAKIESEIQNKSFLISLRRVYWSLIAAQESINISEEMLKISQKLASETRQRFKNSVAEADEVARNDAQVASKQSSLYFYQYQKEILTNQLKTLLPELTKSNIVLADYDISKTINDVTACTDGIAQETNVPYKYTYYDEAVALLRNEKSQAALLNSRYSDTDVKLYGKVKATGIGSVASSEDHFRGSYGSSIDDMEENNRTGYEVGLRVTIPLGSAKEQTKKTMELYDEKRLTSAIDASDARVINTHQQLVKNVILLNQVIAAQKLNSRELEKRLKFMTKKYQQARVSINDLIQDQDALLRADLLTIETQLQVLNAVFDYLAIYTETPCAFNRI
jgi:outer membrane protein TolC